MAMRAGALIFGRGVGGEEGKLKVTNGKTLVYEGKEGDLSVKLIKYDRCLRRETYYEF